MARTKKSGSKKGKTASEGLLTREQQRDILGVGLLALALFVALALVPPAWFGGGADGSPGGNLVGPLGALVRDALTALFGSAAPLAPAALALVGLRSGEWFVRWATLRFTLFIVGLALLLPVGLAVWIGPVAGGGAGGGM